MRFQTTLPPQPRENPVAKYKVGDKVRHEAFGEGTIRVLTPMGGDALVEIVFASGPRRLMLKAASAHMQKL